MALGLKGNLITMPAWGNVNGWFWAMGNRSMKCHPVVINPKCGFGYREGLVAESS